MRQGKSRRGNESKGREGRKLRTSSCRILEEGDVYRVGGEVDVAHDRAADEDIFYRALRLVSMVAQVGWNAQRDPRIPNST